MVEIWKDIPGYESEYQASNWGRIKTNNWFFVNVERIIKQSDDGRGYKICYLHRKRFRVHRLVWEAFNGKIPDGMQVNHINEIKADNRLENLNLMTPKENSNWGTRNKRLGDKRRGIKRPEISAKMSKPVLQYTINMEFVKEWKSAKDCYLNGMGSCGHITECCNGMRPKYKGYIWKYKNGEKKEEF